MTINRRQWALTDISCARHHYRRTAIESIATIDDGLPPESPKTFDEWLRRFQQLAIYYLQMSPQVSVALFFLVNGSRLGGGCWKLVLGAIQKVGEFGDFSGHNYHNDLPGHQFTARTLHQRSSFPRSWMTCRGESTNTSQCFLNEHHRWLRRSSFARKRFAMNGHLVFG